MRINLMKCMERNQLVEIMYMDSKGNISKRRVEILKFQGDTFQVFCFKRNAKRTFIFESVLACVPIIHKEREVV
ncbi:transcriptional regulator [Psychrobacillus sp. FSL K6-2365]|uniref:transcriptional regulator n=1 Tax=Psychrobacillus sp. FSL K6-2365 TaxID=2921546 RepID=UPI0030F56D2D